MTKNVKKLLIILGILVSIALAVVVIPKFQNSTSKEQTPLISKDPLSVNGPKLAPDPSQQFVSLLQSIKTISLDTSLVQSKAFQKLINYGSILPTEASAGRPNPFAPVGQDTVIPSLDSINQGVLNNQSIDTTNKNTTTTNTNQQTKKSTSTTSLDSLDSLLNGL